MVVVPAPAALAAKLSRGYDGLPSLLVPWRIDVNGSISTASIINKSGEGLGAKID